MCLDWKTVVFFILEMTIQDFQLDGDKERERERAMDENACIRVKMD